MLEWGEALETPLFPESSGRLAGAGDVPGLPGWGVQMLTTEAKCGKSETVWKRDAHSTRHQNKLP